MIFSVLIIALLLVWLSYSRYKRLLNPFTLEGYFTIFFLLIPQVCRILWLGDSSYFWSDIVILVYLLAIYCGTLVSIKAFKISPVVNAKASSFVLCCTALFLILFTIPILSNCGLSFTGIRCYYETVVFSKYASFYDLAKRFIEVALLLLIIRYHKFKWYTIILALLLVFSGNKFAILNIIILIVLFFQEYYQISIKKIILFAGFAFSFLIIFHFLTSRTPVGSFWTNALSYFDIYNNQSFLIEKFIDEGFPYYNGEIYTSSFYKYIPRIIWEGKPYNYGFAILNYEFFPEWAKVGYMPSFGLGTSFADFGFFSIALGGFLAGFLRNYVFNIFLKNNKNNVSFFLYFYVFDVVMLIILFIIVIIDHFTRKK